MKLVLATLVVTLTALSATTTSPNEEPKTEKKPTKPESKVGILMKQKLLHSQKVLAGLAKNDFKAIEDGAGELMLISKQTEWMVLKTVHYRMFSNQFRRAAEEMRKNAKEKKIEAVALNYVDLTLSCVNCHKHVREVRMTGLFDVPGLEH